MVKGVKFRAYPNKEQQNLINRTLGCSRMIYNKGLSMRNIAYAAGDKIGYSQTSSMLTELKKPEDYSQEDDAGLDLIDFYVLPHYLTAPFKKVTEKIMTEFSDLNLSPINNRQGIVIDGEGSKVVCKD